MDHKIIGDEHIVTLDEGETFLLMGDRATQWPMVVTVLNWTKDSTYVAALGWRADRNGDPTKQRTCECLMIGYDSRLQHFPEWLTDAIGRGSSPLQLV